MWRLIVSFFVVALLLNLVDQVIQSVWPLLLVALIGFVIWGVYLHNAQTQRRREVTDRARSVIFSHARTLSTKKLQKSRKDDYGNPVVEAWSKEKAYFHNSVIVPLITKEFNMDVADAYETFQTDSLIDEIVDGYLSRNRSKSQDISQLNPYQFEAHCAQLLEEGGWLARTTQGSGDQGIDIMGEKDGFKAVFQVKMYSSPVGNKAVQEAIAGKAFASADLAYVVSNAGYTASARELAHKSGVKLLHYTELNKLTPAHEVA